MLKVIGQNELKDVAGVELIYMFAVLEERSHYTAKMMVFTVSFVFFRKIFLNSYLLDKDFLTNLVAPVFSVLFLASVVKLA